MNSPLISKRQYFLETYGSALERLNEAIQQSDENYFTENGELVIQMEDFPEFAHENVREYLALLLKEGGWQVVFQQGSDSEEDDWMLLY